MTAATSTAATTGAEFLRQTFALDGRVAVVTGASSGLGAHISATLARAGCAVAVAARRQKRLEKLAESIGNFCGDSGASTNALPVVMDVCDRASVEAGFARIVEHFGRIDILLNNAGVAAPQRFLDMTEADWARVVDTDLSAVWRVGQAAARAMVARDDGDDGDDGAGRGGAIINIASMLGLAAQRGQANYGAAKAGVLQLTRVMALELARRNVRVNALAPGYFTTEMNREFLESRRGRDTIAGLLPGRAGALRELDGAVLLLAGDAGSYINGSVLSVDGGAALGGL